MLHELARLGHNKIIDVGGAPNRHSKFVKKNGRLPFNIKHIHCCSPIMDKTDVFRAFEISTKQLPESITYC